MTIRKTSIRISRIVYCDWGLKWTWNSKLQEKLKECTKISLNDGFIRKALTDLCNEICHYTSGQGVIPNSLDEDHGDILKTRKCTELNLRESNTKRKNAEIFVFVKMYRQGMTIRKTSIRISRIVYCDWGLKWTWNSKLQEKLKECTKISLNDGFIRKALTDLCNEICHYTSGQGKY